MNVPDITYSYVIIFQLLLNCLRKVSSEAMKNPNVGSLKYILVMGVEPPVVPVLYRFRASSEPVLGWYRFDWSITVSGTGFAAIFKFFIENFLKIVF